MKAIILLGTHKMSGLSNTETLCEFLSGRMRRQGSRAEIVKLVDYSVLPWRCSDMGKGDEWPGIVEKILGSEIIFATPI